MEVSKTCIVAGGAGFIGSHLVDALLGKGVEVICLDNLVTGQEGNIVVAKKDRNFTFVRHDVTEIWKPDKHIEFVFHLASPASPVDYQKYPEETALVNSIGTINLLKIALEHGSRFLFASTSEVYGDPLEHPQKEAYWGNVNPNGLRSCYDESKRFGEMMSLVYQRRDKLDVRIVRIFNTYGPRMRPTDGRVVSNFITEALLDKHITVYGDGEQTRSLCYVDDLVLGILRVMFTDGLTGEVINLGNPEEYSVNNLANQIIELTNSKSTISFFPLPADDPKKRRPDIEKAIKLLKWEPKVSLLDGLDRTISYFKSIIKI